MLWREFISRIMRRERKPPPRFTVWRLRRNFPGMKYSFRRKAVTADTKAEAVRKCDELRAAWPQCRFEWSERYER